MEVDVAVLHQQPRAERAYEVRFGAHRAPDGLQIGVADDLAGALLVGGRNFEDVVHVVFFRGYNGGRSGPAAPSRVKSVLYGYLPSRMRAWATAASVISEPESILAISVTRSSSPRRVMSVRPPRL